MKDAPLRLRCSAGEVCSLAPNPAEKGYTRTREAMSRRHADAFVIPLALGAHVDHRTVRDAALAGISPSAACAFYEDLPYAARPGVLDIEAKMLTELADASGLELMPGFAAGQQNTEASVANKRKAGALLRLADRCRNRGADRAVLPALRWPRTSMGERGVAQACVVRASHSCQAVRRMRPAGFKPRASLLRGKPLVACCACIVIPVRNERRALPSTLDAFAEQVDCAGHPLDPECFEVVLLLNNCTDDSMQVAKLWKGQHPDIRLHIVKRSIPASRAHVGTARRWLMDTAWRRMAKVKARPSAILSTDADTVVARDWIAQNMRAIARGAQAVGGVIRWKPGHLEKLPPDVQRAVLDDREYQQLQAELEHLLDPQEGDPWPRHTEHFGASLACTPHAYARAGGLPAVRHLEDIAFVMALERAGLTVRHEPEVIVYTSGRLNGRSPVGLSGQLRRWQRMSRNGRRHMVPSATWLAYRFATLRKLRGFHAGDNAIRLQDFPEIWRQPMRNARKRNCRERRFLDAIECERLMWESFRGRRDQTIKRANASLRAEIRKLHRLNPSSAI